MRLLVAYALIFLLSACNRQEAAVGTAGPAAKTGAQVAATYISEVEILKVENAKLQAEVSELRKRLEEMSVTAPGLLERVNSALAEGKESTALKDLESLEKRFPGSAQAKAARVAHVQYVNAAAAQEAQAKELGARGFYALKPLSAFSIGDVILKVESINIGGRWSFDEREDGNHYREAERGDRFVLLRATVQSGNKSPDLPDVGIYRIDGKRMIRMNQFSYEFRRWSSYGSYIGLYQDYKNDFAHSSTVPFNAAATITEEDSKLPFAVVGTGELCHQRSSNGTRPKEEYILRSCAAKGELTLENFTDGGYRVLAFFNRPKGI